MNSKTIVSEKTGFEVYLEGIKAPPASIRIDENEGGFPTASVSFPATSAMFRVLPGTKVQIFGKDPLTEESIILFEGEITAVGYNKSGASRSVSFNCKSFLAKWGTVTSRPKDSMVTPVWREASGDVSYDYKNLTDDQKQEGQKPSYLMKATAQAIKERTKQQVSGALENVLDEITLTNFTGFYDELVQVLRDESVSAGNLDILVQYFIRKFEVCDPFYGMESSAYGISNSISTWPNFGKIDPFKNKAALQTSFKMASEFKNAFKDSGSLVLLRALQTVLQSMQYNILSPSCFTGSQRFWSEEKLSEADLPVRAYFTPNLENTPPAKFNLLFPHQVMSFNYSRSFAGEPTRTIGEVQMKYLTAATNMRGAKAFITEPGLNITRDGVAENSIGFTPEETYRGIKANQASFDSFFSEVREDEVGDNKAADDAKKESYMDLVKPSLTHMTKNSHLQGRMASRSVSFQTTWSPYRMTGVPGAYIEQGDGPSITGVISSITTNITANGSATSTITFRSPRLIFKKDDLDSDEDMINDFSLDPYLDTNSFMFDSEIYGFDKVGSSLFAYMKNGRFSNKNKAIKDYVEKGVELEGEEKPYKPFEESSSKIGLMFNPSNAVDTDASILDFLDRDKDNNILNTLATDLELSEMEDHTRNVYEAVYKITDLYKNIEGEGALIDKWTNNITHRNIINKKDYFRSNGVEEPESLENCKDGIRLFTGTEVISAIKDSIKSSRPQNPTSAPNADDLESSKKAIQRRIKLLTDERDKLEGINSLDGSEKYLVYAAFSALTGKPINLELEPLDRENLDTLDLGYIDKFKNKIDRKVSELSTEKDKLDQQISEIVEEVQTESTSDTIDLPAKFETELFKAYNLTRRKHVDVALTRYVRQSLKSQEEDNSDSDIRQNINILE
jgi:hypothetical protein